MNDFTGENHMAEQYRNKTDSAEISIK